MAIKKNNMGIKKNNIEVRKNWNRFSFKKLGAILCLFLLGIVTFISGNLSQVNAASSSTVLPVAKGGTGANSISEARNNLQAEYAGNKVTSISSSSNDTQYPSAKSVYDYNLPAVGIDNFYMKTSLPLGPGYIFLLGQLPTEASGSNIRTFFGGTFLAARIADPNAWPGMFNAKIDINAGYANSSLGLLTNVVPTINNSGGMSTNFAAWQLGKFTYDAKNYIGLAMTGGSTFWNLTHIILKGFYTGTLPAKCPTANDLCVGQKILYSSVTNYTKVWPV
ncbi:MAG: hypothetical protein LBT99_01800 [Bifidobacteriaceae bacterium]|jgi:hypothetical protein|nr:hypothetical protein [Bifidobacteriaceae bacterium]